jgi:ribose transport system permease protein
MKWIESIKRGRVTREWGLFCAILFLIALFSFLFPVSFPTFGNFSAILRNLALDAIMAAGMLILMVSGLFDLSVGGMFSMAGVLTGWLMKNGGVPVPLAIFAGLAVAALGGFINGFVVARVRVNALITTLGTMQIFRGVAVLVGGPGISFLPASFSNLGQAKWLGLQSSVWLMAGVIACFHFLLRRTRFFRQYYYIGGNEKAAVLSGIPVPKMQIAAFTISGFLAGLAGIVFAARIATSVSVAGDGAELRIITAVILGGASLKGGKGSILGALVGVVFIALINNLMIIAKISSYWQSIVIGLVLVLAVSMDYFLEKK